MVWASRRKLLIINPLLSALHVWNMHNIENYSGEELFALETTNSSGYKIYKHAYINLCTCFNTDEIHLELAINQGLGGLWIRTHGAAFLAAFCFCKPSKLLLTCAHFSKHCRDWHEILHSAGSSQKLPQWTTLSVVCTAMWTVGGCVLHSTVMLRSQSAQHLPEEKRYCSIVLTVPTDLASSAGRHSSCSETNGLPALHSSCSHQPLSIICFPFQPSTSHSFNVAGWKVSAGFLVSAAGSRVVFVTCSREQARSRQPGRASSQEVEF